MLNILSKTTLSIRRHWLLMVVPFNKPISNCPQNSQEWPQWKTPNVFEVL